MSDFYEMAKCKILGWVKCRDTYTNRTSLFITHHKNNCELWEAKKDHKIKPQYSLPTI
jgi:hypothetical protein